MSIEFKDVTGSLRPIGDLEKTLRTVETEAIKGDHTAMFKDGTPAMMVYFDIVCALRELISIRKAMEKIKPKEGE